MVNFIGIVVGAAVSEFVIVRGWISRVNGRKVFVFSGAN